MKITNKYGLPGAIVEAVKNDDYDPGDSDITVTGLLQPPRLRALYEKHKEEIVEDASSRIWALIGQSVHTILERAEPSAITEERLYMHMEGWKVGGKFDRMTLRVKTLQDYKVCSVWEHIYGLKPEKEQQLNLLALLAAHNGYKEISNLEIVAIFRDWSQAKARYDKKYPQAQVARVKVKMWPVDRQVAFLRERVMLHQKALKELPECSEEDRWATPDKFAIMKKGRKSAIRLYTSMKEATANLKQGQYIEHRKGESKRCAMYCPVKGYCSQFSSLCSE